MEAGEPIERGVNVLLERAGHPHAPLEREHPDLHPACRAIEPWIHPADQPVAGQDGQRVVSELPFVRRDVDLPDIGEAEEIGQPLAPPEEVVEWWEEADGAVGPSTLGACLTVVAAQRREVAGERVVRATHSLDLQRAHVALPDALFDDLPALRSRDLPPAEPEVAEIEDPVGAEIFVEQGCVGVRARDLLRVAQDIGWHDSLGEIEMALDAVTADDHHLAAVPEHVEGVTGSLRPRTLIVPVPSDPVVREERARGQGTAALELPQDHRGGALQDGAFPTVRLAHMLAHMAVQVRRQAIIAKYRIGKEKEVFLRANPQFPYLFAC